MAKKDLIADAVKRGLTLTGRETVADLTALLTASGEASADVDAEAGAPDADAIDADIAALTAQLAERLSAKAKARDGATLSAAQADNAAVQLAADVAVQLENDRRQAEHDATQESLARSRDVPGAGAWTPHGVHYGSGCI